MLISHATLFEIVPGATEDEMENIVGTPRWNLAPKAWCRDSGNDRIDVLSRTSTFHQTAVIIFAIHDYPDTN